MHNHVSDTACLPFPTVNFFLRLGEGECILDGHVGDKVIESLFSWDEAHIVSAGLSGTRTSLVHVVHIP